MLDATRIERELAARGTLIGRPLVAVATTASTNDDARAAAIAGAPHGTAFVADAQTRGRGRGEHGWHSPLGENVYLSIVLRPDLAGRSLPLVTLAIGVAAARVVERALADVRDAQIGLKWPNDVLVGRRKIAGVLVEGPVRGDRALYLVAGVGLNVATRSFPAELAARATSLAQLGATDLAREPIVTELCVEIAGAVSTLERGGDEEIVREVSRRDALRDRRVEVGSVSGVARGVAHDGRLLVTDDAGTQHAVAAGEVTLRW